MSPARAKVRGRGGVAVLAIVSDNQTRTPGLKSRYRPMVAAKKSVEWKMAKIVRKPAPGRRLERMMPSDSTTTIFRVTESLRGRKKRPTDMPESTGCQGRRRVCGLVRPRMGLPLEFTPQRRRGGEDRDEWRQATAASWQACAATSPNDQRESAHHKLQRAIDELFTFTAARSMRLPPALSRSYFPTRSLPCTL